MTDKSELQTVYEKGVQALSDAGSIQPHIGTVSLMLNDTGEELGEVPLAALAAQPRDDVRPELDAIIHGSMDKDFERKAALAPTTQPVVVDGKITNAPPDERNQQEIDAAVRDLQQKLAAHNSTQGTDSGLADALRIGRDIALSHSNYGHVEGNRRAFAIIDDFDKRIKAIKRALAEGAGK